MKKIYLIQYKTTDSQLFENRIKSLSSNWFKYFTDNWIVSTELLPKAIYDHIAEGVDDSSIFIVEIVPNNYYGRMNTKLWEFLKSNKTNK